MTCMNQKGHTGRQTHQPALPDQLAIADWLSGRLRRLSYRPHAYVAGFGSLVSQPGLHRMCVEPRSFFAWHHQQSASLLLRQCWSMRLCVCIQVSHLKARHEHPLALDSYARLPSLKLRKRPFIATHFDWLWKITPCNHAVKRSFCDLVTVAHFLY
ncbi:hypothetical protein D3C85_1057550 [compost metagenome]